jgi:hypothetical protein
VSPGATWRTTFSQQIPFADTPIQVTGRNTLVNYDRVGGSASAVVTSDITMPLELSIDARKLLASAGGKVDPKMAKANIGISGAISLFQTSWLDPVAKEFTESSVLGHVDIAVNVDGTDSSVAGQAGGRFQGTLTVQIQRIGSPGSGTSGPERHARDALRRALAAADIYFAASHTYRGFSEAKASSVAPSLHWRSGGKTAPGIITIRVTSGSSVLLLTQDPAGKPMCIARTKAGTTRYGRVGAARPVGCRGGW